MILQCKTGGKVGNAGFLIWKIFSTIMFYGLMLRCIYMQDAMQETMNEINGEGSSVFGLNKKEILQDMIKKLKTEIKNAQEILDQTSSSLLYEATSPEQANLNKKTIVFLKRDLAAKEDEYEQCA